MNRSDKRSILQDLLELIERAKDANVSRVVVASLNDAASRLELDSRPSVPPLSNEDTRRTAAQLFQRTRELLRGIK